MERHGVTVHEYERLDDLHRNGYRIIQNPAHFCFGMDAVLLSGFARLKKNETVLDLGTGTGIIPILLCGKSEATRFAGLEIQPASVDMARRSVKLNGLDDRIKIEEGDIKNAVGIFKPSSFDAVTANPPYMKAGGGILNADSPRAIARHEILCGLEDVTRAAAKLLRPGGRLYMVHRPHRLIDIVCTLRSYALEPKVLRFVHAYAHRAPILILLEAARGGSPMLKIPEPLVIYNDGGEYTPETYAIYYE